MFEPSHVLVVGAGPAGSMAALLLAQAGVAVAVVEQHRFPRYKVCGECISDLGLAVLSRAGLLGQLRAAGAVSMSRAILHTPAGHHAEITLPRPIWGLSRRRMDTIILQAAIAAGAELLQPVRCEAIEPGLQPRVTLRDLRTNVVHTYATTCGVLADGKSALLPPRPRPTNDLGLKAHFAGIDAPRDAVQLFGVDGHYGGIAPIEDGLWNVAFSVPARRLDGADLDGLFTRIVAENHTLTRSLKRASRVGDWLTCPLPRFAPRSHWPDGVVPLGNAAASIEPIGGEGMGLALRSAEIFASAFIAGQAAGTEVDRRLLMHRFRQLWSIRRRAARIAALAMAHPRTCVAAQRILAIAPSLGRTALRLIGKSPEPA